jgi:ribosomal protein S18 acetylase RimI-like enzyme
MIITRGYLLEDRERLHEINEAAYSGIQRPSPVEFDDMLGNRVFVSRAHIEDGGNIYGFAICRDGDWSPYLWSLAVDPEYQGRGVGGNLLREVIKYYTLAKAMGRDLSLHVHPDNPAQKLYFDYGFRVRSIAKNWYRPEGDGLYMYRML